MGKLLLMAMLALTLYAPAALAQDDDGFDDNFDDNGGVAAPAQYGDDDIDDDGFDDDSGAPLPSTGGPALLPIAGAALLLGVGSAVGIGAALKRLSGRRLRPPPLLLSARAVLLLAGATSVNLATCSTSSSDRPYPTTSIVPGHD